MKTTSSFFEQLLHDETNVESVSPLASQHKQIRRLASSLLVACMHQQLQTDLGKELVMRILGRHAQQIKATPAFADLSLEGNRLLGTLLPGKKSVMMRIMSHHARLPFKDIDSIVGASAYTLFTKLAVNLVDDTETTSFLLPIRELDELAPELSTKDYLAIGAYSVLSLSNSSAIPA